MTVRKMDKQIWEVDALLNQDYNEVKAAVLNYWKADATEEQIEDLIERFVERSERTVETVKAVWGTELEEYRYMKNSFETKYQYLLDLGIILANEFKEYKYMINTFPLASYVLDENDRTNNWIEVINKDETDIYFVGMLHGETYNHSATIEVDYQRMEQYITIEGNRIYSKDIYNPNVSVFVSL